MLEERSYLRSLSELATQEATGEYIIVANDVEAHVYFQCGRVAWGTNSLHHHAFSRHLFHECQVDQELFMEVLATCQREHKRLGETLISWGLASLEQVRDALASQLLETLRTVADLPYGQNVFLPRSSYEDYDGELTFSFDELIERIGRQTALARGAGKESRSRRTTAHEIFDELQLDIPSAFWLELHSEEGTEAVPKSHEDLVGEKLLDILELSDSDFLAIRTMDGILMGGHLLGRDDTIWTGLGADATMGSAISSLAPILVADLQPRETMSKHTQASWTLQGREQELLDRVASAIAETDEMLAVFCLPQQGPPLWSCVREGIDVDALLDRSRARSKALYHDVVDISLRCPDGCECDDDEPAMGNQRTIVVADDEMWAYGGSCWSDEMATLWVCVDRSASQGLGWAILSSISRLTSTLREAA